MINLLFCKYRDITQGHTTRAWFYIANIPMQKALQIWHM